MFIKEDLKPGDIIVSYKPSSDLKFLRRLFDGGIERYSKELFGDDCVFPLANHSRWVVSTDKIFHWTFPKSQYQDTENWMVDPDYAMVMRRIGTNITTQQVARFCDKNIGTFYDLGELADMWFGFPRFFDLGPNHHVCSTGCRAGMESLGYTKPFNLRTSKTPPCLWPNLNLYRQVNSSRGHEVVAPTYCEVSKAKDLVMPKRIDTLERTLHSRMAKR